jgi:NAD+ kinase
VSSKPLRLLIIARDERSHVQQAAARLENFLYSQPGVELIGMATTDALEDEHKKADLALVVGGDGAILRACKQFAEVQVPVLGINLGRLGFLADATMDDFQMDFPSIVGRKYQITNHLMYQCRIHTSAGVSEFLGLNEVAICSDVPLAMIDVELSIDGEKITTYSGDGVLISTPIGSTAHSLSAGGPILRQDMPAFVITPICPHTLTVRPIVDRSDRLYQFRVAKTSRGGIAIMDGQSSVAIANGDLVEVRAAKVDFQLVRLPCHSFYATLHRKLGWDGQPRYRQAD